MSDLDLIARKVAMSALLYYGLDLPIATDAQYDKWCRRIADEWDDLDPVRRWQLRSREDVTVTGMDFIITQACYHGAVAWMRSEGTISLNETVVPVKVWSWAKKRKLHWLYPDDFKLVKI